jgi:hypothetical protein
LCHLLLTTSNGTPVSLTIWRIESLPFPIWRKVSSRLSRGSAWNRVANVVPVPVSLDFFLTSENYYYFYNFLCNTLKIMLYFLTLHRFIKKEKQYEKRVEK